MNSALHAKKFYRDQLVEVRSAAEIAATLDANGTLEGLPFMPEMLAYCGRAIRVQRRADRSCVGELGFRRMRGTVFLQGARCDGSAHDHCDRGCLLFWKEAWLKPATVEGGQQRGTDGVAGAVGAAVTAGAAGASGAAGAVRTCITRVGERYVCQATELINATVGPYSRWNAAPLLRDVAHGELSVRAFLELLARTVLNRMGWRRLQPLLGTPGRKQRGALGLREGEWVKVKSKAAIAEQLDERGGNCGMVFRPTMHAAIGGRYQVAFPVHRIISDDGGKMIELKNTVALKGVVCEGPCVANCPRSEYLYWRESWLERAEPAPPS